MKETKHIPVLLEEVKESLHLQNGMVVVDATLGGGSHARMMLELVLPKGRVIAIDTDHEALRRFQDRVVGDDLLHRATLNEQLLMIQGNYSELGRVLDQHGIERVDAILADLGFSSDQIEEPSRGLSFQGDGPLDMRLNQETVLTARTIVNTYTQDELLKILFEYGGESESRRIVEAILRERVLKPIEKTHELAAMITDAYPKRSRALLKIHPATKTFQALRIAVNDELTHLETFLREGLKRLTVGGYLAVITFHSGEEKCVKQFFKEQAQGCICPPNFPICLCGQVPRIKIVTKKPIIAGKEEREKNPRSRSAKLRVIQKIV